MPLVAVTDASFPDLEVEQAELAPLGCELKKSPDSSPTALCQAVAQADAVLTQFGRPEGSGRGHAAGTGNRPLRHWRG